MNKILLNTITLAIVAAALSGCAVFLSDVEGMREIDSPFVRTFDKDIPACYELTSKALAKWGAIRFQERDGDYIVAMKLDGVVKSSANTTELGIFFEEVTPEKTKIRVASLNSDLARGVAEKLFYYIYNDGKEPVSESTTDTPAAAFGR